MITLKDIELARAAISRFDQQAGAGIRRTPLLPAEGLGASTGTRLFFKAECLQQTGSFKLPGVINALLAATRPGSSGILGVSSGNQGLAVAYVAALLGKPALIVMPPGASAAKAAAIHAVGGETTQAHFTSYDDARALCTRLAQERNYDLPDLFADPNFIAGHGTLGLQILDELPQVDAIIVPGGSGVLAAGLATACKAVRPGIRVVAACAENSPGLQTAFRTRQPVVLARMPETVCDGLRSPVVSGLVLEHVLQHVDDVISVSDREVLEAMRLIWTQAKLLVEPSAAVTLAALRSGRVPVADGATVVCVLTGGNVDLQDALRYLTA